MDFCLKFESEGQAIDAFKSAGYIGEALFYTALLTTEQRAAVINNLRTKWGI